MIPFIYTFIGHFYILCDGMNLLKGISKNLVKLSLSKPTCDFSHPKTTSTSSV